MQSMLDIANQTEKINLNGIERLTDNYLPVLFAVINYTHFNDEIRHCRTKWSDRIGTGKHGHRLSDFTVFDDDQFAPVIRLSKCLLLEETDEKVCKALFESMVHVWLWEQKKPWGHTREFQEKAETFEFSLIESKVGF